MTLIGTAVYLLGGQEMDPKAAIVNLSNFSKSIVCFCLQRVASLGQKLLAFKK
jgi:hypothetical protein